MPGSIQNVFADQEIERDILICWQVSEPACQLVQHQACHQPCGFGTATSLWIHVPQQTKRGPDVVDFPTNQKRHVQQIAQTLNKLYQGQPIGSGKIGTAYGMGYHQILIYLHQANEAGLVRAVYTKEGGPIRGWVPANSDYISSVAEQKAMRAAEAVRNMANGKPVSTKAVALSLQVPSGTLIRWLNVALSKGLIRQPENGRGWLPL